MVVSLGVPIFRVFTVPGVICIAIGVAGWLVGCFGC